jgi:oxygen-independent coproporphyrinogen-3 oxidase
LDHGVHFDSIVDLLQQRFRLSAGRADLLLEIASVNRHLVPCPEIFNPQQQEVSLYLGIPYCTSRCVYCSFPSAILPADTGQIFSLLTAIGQDIEAVVKLMGNYGLKPRALYIGGGTPTCLPADAFRRLLETIGRLMPYSWLEYTVEAGRPESIDAEKLKIMHDFGVSRISVNPQTMHEQTLRRIGRRHSMEQVLNAVAMVRSAGIKNVNMDLIAGLPGESALQMQESLEAVLGLRPENVTIHTLAVKRGADLNDEASQLLLPSGELMTEMVEASRTLLRASGYRPYYLYRQKNSPGRLENVGYSLPGTECFYNVDIMEERRTIIGIGPSAATKLILSSDWRLESLYFPKNIPTYIQTLPRLLEKREQLFEKIFWKESVL